MIGANEVRRVFKSNSCSAAGTRMTDAEILSQVYEFWNDTAPTWKANAYSALVLGLGYLVRSSPHLLSEARRLLNSAHLNVACAIRAMDSSELCEVIRGFALFFEASFQIPKLDDNSSHREIHRYWDSQVSLEILNSWDERVSLICSQFKGRDAITSILAIGQAKAAHLSCLDRLWNIFLAESRKLSVMTLAQVAYAAAVLRCSRKDVINSLDLEVRRLVTLNRNASMVCLSGPRAIKLLWAFAILKIPVGQKFADRIVANISRDSFSREGLFALHQAALILGIDLPVALKQHVDKALSAHACSRMSTNRWEGEIAEILSSLGFAPKLQWHFDGYSADVALEGGRFVRPILFEFDGPCHFLPNGRNVARDGAKNEVARRRGLRLVRIDSEDWSSLTKTERFLLIESKVI